MKAFLDFEDGQPAIPCRPEDVAILADFWRAGRLGDLRALERLRAWERERLRQRRESMHDG